MGRRRYFVTAVLCSALLVVGLWQLWHQPVNMEEEQARALMRVWLAADFRDGGGDPALRAPQNGPPQANVSEVAQIRFASVEVVRPFIRPPNAEFAALARVKLQTGGPAMTEGETVRYFLLVQPHDATWQVQSEITESAFRWRLGS